MKNERDKIRISKYLLGELPEAEQTAYEQELLADKEAFDQVWLMENQLIDAYVRREMSRSQRERFERFYLASPLHGERVAVAGLLLEEADARAGVEAPFEQTEAGNLWWRRLLGLFSVPNLALGAAAAALLLVAGLAGWLWTDRSRLKEQLVAQQRDVSTIPDPKVPEIAQLQQQKEALENDISRERERNEKLAAELKRLRQQSESAPAAAFSFLLTAAPTRGGNVAPPPQVPLLKGPVRLVMKLDGDQYPRYEALIKTVDGREVLRRTVGSTKDHPFVTVTLPPGKLAKNDYVLVLSGRNAAGTTEEIDQYLFRVQ